MAVSVNSERWCTARLTPQQKIYESVKVTFILPDKIYQINLYVCTVGTAFSGRAEEREKRAPKTH